MSRPGSSPLTDIVEYNATIFGSEIDNLVRVLAQRPEQVRQRVEQLLWENWESWTHRPMDGPALRSALLAILQESDAG
jgi:hypothetical protein